jgi:hypothetical protein
MAAPLSVDDAFTVGVSFDLLGGYLLGRSLLASPSEIASRTVRPTTWGHGFNADAQAGLISLGIGFSLQWGGYLAIIAGATVDTGLGRAVLSLALSVLAAVGAYLLFRRLRWKLVKRLAVRVARADPLTGTMDAAPDAQTLLALGRALGIAYVEVTEQGVTPIDPWAREHFGVAVVHRYPPDMPAPHGR